MMTGRRTNIWRCQWTATRTLLVAAVAASGPMLVRASCPAGTLFDIVTAEPRFLATWVGSSFLSTLDAVLTNDPGSRLSEVRS